MRTRPSPAGLLAGLLLAPVLVVLGWSAGSPAMADDAYEPTALPGPGGLLGIDVVDVDCWSPGNCVAVGAKDVSGSSQQRQVLFQQTDGVWGAEQSPAPTNGSGAGRFESVSCPAVGFCVAVGREGSTSGGTTGLIATLSGGSWSAMTSGLSNGYTQSLVDVSCASASSCAAVGSSYTSGGPQRAMAVRLAGGTWTASQVQPPELASGVPAVRAALLGVSCYATGTCVAVGKSEGGSGQSLGLIAQLSAGDWTPQNAPQPSSSTATTSQLFSVSCAASGRCAAGGEYLESGGPPYIVNGMLIARAAGGSWTATAAPKPAGAQNVRLTATSCADDGTCAVVGTATYPYNASAPTQPSGGFPVVETLTSSGWTARPVTFDDLPHPVSTAYSQTSSLLGVSCVDGTVCTAVGSYATDRNDDGRPESGAEGLVVDVDPTTGNVTAQDAPLPADGEAATGYQDVPLTGVRCLDAEHCTIAGTYVYDTPNGDDAQNGLALEKGGAVTPPEEPTITSISPKQGPKRGGTTVTVRGSGFVGEVTVRFGSAEGTRVRIVDEGGLTVRTPKHKPGRVAITVRADGGTARGATFRYR